MYTQQDLDRTAAVTANLPGYHSRAAAPGLDSAHSGHVGAAAPGLDSAHSGHVGAAAPGLDSAHSGHVGAAAPGLDSAHSGPARAVRGARLLMLRWLAGRRRVTGLALATAGWAATLAAVVVSGHLGRGAAAQIAFAAIMISSAMSETLLSPARPVVIADRASPAAAGRSSRLGTVALVTGCLLVPPACGAALGVGWATSLLPSLAVACAVASIAAHRLGRPAEQARVRGSQVEMDHVRP